MEEFLYVHKFNYIGTLEKRKGNSCVSYKNDAVEKVIKITLNVFKSINSQICFFTSNARSF